MGCYIEKVLRESEEIYTQKSYIYIHDAGPLVRRVAGILSFCGIDLRPLSLSHCRNDVSYSSVLSRV